MKHVGLDERVRIAFADTALAYFAKHPDKHTFTTGEVREGVLFAVKWRFNAKTPEKVYSVLVFSIEDTMIVDLADGHGGTAAVDCEAGMKQRILDDQEPWSW